MIKYINLKGNSVEYNLEIKPVKNINLRIKADKSIYVSANKSIDEKIITDFLLSKSDYILNALKKYDEMLKYAENNKLYVDGESYKVFGHNRRLVVKLSSKNYIVSDESYIYLFCKNVEYISIKRKMLNRWLQKQLQSEIVNICNNTYRKFEKYDISFPVIRYRNMVSRWGSCQPKKCVLTFNYALINVPIACIEYVIMHEFTHFLQPNHSKKFYNQLSMFMPDWRERKKMLDMEIVQGL